MPRVIPLRKPLTRRIGPLVVTIDGHGVTLRGFRRRCPQRFSWAQVASLADASKDPIIALDEERVGRNELEALGAAGQ